MSRLSFVHTSDLHLDSPFVGVTATAPEIAQRLRSATFEAFDRIVTLCLERGVDCLLVAGDVYDGADRSLRAQLRFRDGLNRLSERGIRAFVAHGNHDPLDGWSSAIEWPPGVSILGSELETLAIERGGEQLATVTGMSYPRRQELRNLAQLFPAEGAETQRDDSLFRIGLLHANCGREVEHDPYAPCELADLRGRAIDYWALGHIHTRKTLSEGPHVVYPGNPQGRSVRETGARGCLFVEANGRRVTTEFVAIDAVRWEVLTVDIGPLMTLDALDAALFQAVDEAIASSERRDLICRIRIIGRGPLFRELRRPDHVPQLRQRLREAFSERRPWAWIEDIDVECLPEIDITSRRRSQDLGGELLRAADDWRAGELRSALWPALEPLFGARRVAAVLPPPDDIYLERVLAEAELLCVDKLDTSE